MSLFATIHVSGSGARGSADAVPVAAPTDRVYPSMHSDPLVSVIVPCYNGAQFLEEALRSALSQSHPRVEIIVVDDGSTDNSPEIAQRFPVRYVRQRNSGLPDARNTGIRKSKGTYLVFLDADDRLSPKAIEIGLRALEQRPDCALVVGDHVFISADGSHLAHSGKTDPLNSHYEALLKSNFIEMISTVLFRRSVFDEVGVFNESLRAAEDYELYLRIARVRPICCHPAVVAEYRMHKTNISRNPELMLTTTLHVLESNEKYIHNDSVRRLAFREGVRSWKKQYGRQLATELARSFSTLKVDHLRRKLLLLAVNYPQGFLLIMALRILKAFSHRTPLAGSGQPVQVPARSRFDVLLRRQSGSKPVAVQKRTLHSKLPATPPTETVSR